MKIEASVGNAPQSVSLKDKVYSLRLVAQTEGEKQRLAALFTSVCNMPPAVLRDRPPIIKIEEKKSHDTIPRSQSQVE